MIKGTAGRCAIATVPQPERPKRKKKLFLTRLEPTTTSPEIEKYLMTTAKLEYVKVFQLKTKHQSYSSFCIVVNENEFTQIKSPAIWPEHTLCSEYLGPLFKDRLLKLDEDENDFALVRRSMEKEPQNTIEEPTANHIF